MHWALGKTLKFEKSSKPVFNYGRLFADPNSEEWTGNGVRLQISSYLGDQGWGRNKPKKYGEGVPPVGYPEGPKWKGPKWTEFKGVSKISKEVGTQIIFSLLKAQNIDPEKHGPQKELDSSEGSEDDLDQVTDSDNDRLSVVPDDGQANLINTSTIRKQLLEKMNTAIADLDSSTELFSPPRHPKSTITEKIKKGTKNIDCSLKQIISLVKCDECEFVTRNKKELKSHIRKQHAVKGTDKIIGKKRTISL